MQLFDGQIKSGKLPASVSKAIALALQMFEGRRVKIALSEYKPPRSSKQNRYYWGYVIPVIVQMFRDAGNSINGEEVHEYLKSQVGDLTEIVTMPDGKRRIITKSSAKLTTAEWEDYIDKIRAWAARYGVAVPFPREDENGF